MRETVVPFEQVWESLDSSGAPLLWAWRCEAMQSKPYQGLKIYHNIPLSLETLCKIEALSAAGAEIVVSSTDFLVPATYPEARASIEAMGLEYREQKHAEPGEFDFYLDCCAELSDLPPPTKGIVELTRTGTLIYQRKNILSPILSVDDSYLKALETYYGTGESFVRAFTELSKKSLSNEIFAVIGYGKVGQGIAASIRKNKGTCLIFDIDPKARQKATLDGFEAHPCGDAIDRATVIVTATGIKHVLKSLYLDAADRFAGKILCNMGADDEIGTGFQQSDVLAGGRTINFTLRHPTLMRYLDPSFYAHNLAIQLIQDRACKPGFHPFPPEMDLLIIQRWAQIHNESLSPILEKDF